jgi:FixJ family two-component response regulator
MNGSERHNPRDDLRSSAIRLIETLDPLEERVLACLVWGMSSRNIASSGGLRMEEVERSFQSLMGKLQAGHIADAVRVGICAGMGRPY